MRVRAVARTLGTGVRTLARIASELTVWSVGRHKGRCHLFDMLFGGGSQQWVIGIFAPAGVVPLTDGFTEGSKHSYLGGFVEFFHEGVGAEFKAVGKFDPAA